MKFKPGDRVVCVSSITLMLIQVGEKYIITGFKYYNGYDGLGWYYHIEGKPPDCCWHEIRFKLDVNIDKLLEEYYGI